MYPYIIYRLYTWRIKNKDSDPAFKVVITLAIVHSWQILFICNMLATFIRSWRPVLDLSRITFALIVLGLVLFLWTLVYNKDKWEGYISRFQHETKAQRKRGTILVLLFTVGTLILSLAGAIVFGTYRTNHEPAPFEY